MAESGVLLTKRAPADIPAPAQARADVCGHCGFALDRGRKGPGPFFCCYGCAFAHQLLISAPAGEKKISWILVQLGAAAFLAMNVMGFSLAMHASSVYPDFYALIPESGRLYDQLLRYVLLMMSAPVLFLVGVPLFENVITEARAGRWGVEGFISASVLAAFAYSTVSTVRGNGPIYFDIAVMVLVFLTLGRYLEARFRSKAAERLESLLDEDKPQTIRLFDNGAQSETVVPIEDLAPSDEIILRAGERVPVDGLILSGRAVIETAPMTGESIPSVKNTGDAVWSGAVLTEGFIRVRVTHASRDSWLARLRATLERARRSKSRIELLASKTVIAVTLLTVISAGAAFWLGLYLEGAMAGLMRALSVLVIVCPCALGAAIPLALWRSFEKIAARGILFKDLALLETATKVRGIFFDKTGTLTDSLPEISGIINYSPYSDDEILRIAGCLAQASMHPFSRALAAQAERRSKLAMPEQVHTEAGAGLSGIVEPYGTAALGSIDFLKRSGLQSSGTAEGARADQDALGSVHLSLCGRLAARFDLKESIRPEASDAVRRLKDAGYSVGILTGDSGRSANRVGRTLGIQAVTGLSPEGKLRWLREWEKDHGPALIVGDGLNDAPALAGSSVSMAMGGALAGARNAADFSLPDNDLGRIPWLMDISRATLRKIRVNLFWAFFYNGLAVPLAVAGWVNPIVASMAMIVSSACIILHSLSER